MSKQSPRFGNVLLCDHVVPGLGNKHTLVNVYSGDVYPVEFPARLLFGLYIEHFPRGGSQTELIDIAINLDDRQVLRVGAELSAPEANGQPGVIPIQVFAVEAERPSTLVVTVALNGGAPETILTKQIRLAP